MTPLSKKELEEIRERFAQYEKVKSHGHGMAVEPPNACSLCVKEGQLQASIEMHSHADTPRLLETIEHLQKYQQHSSGCALYELRDYNVFGKIACTCGLVEKEG